ncbi:MAG: hypothetical protein HQK60_14820 [Deltaproteobacteria bacterium]|nr:hypothetical protein [Deltaproteobacteria bacterium]
MDENFELKQQNLLLVEGQDEVNFFGALLKHLNIESVQIVGVGGKDNFKPELQALLNISGFNDVKSYAIIRDADRSKANTLKSIKGLLKKHKQPVPPDHAETATANNLKVGIFIMPGNAAEGMLEDLCLQAVKNHTVLKCADDYLACLETNLETLANGQEKEPGKQYFPKNRAKARMHSFLAGMHEYIPSVGEAAYKKEGYFDLTADAFKELRDFLTYKMGWSGST